MALTHIGSASLIDRSASASRDERMDGAVADGGRENHVRYDSRCTFTARSGIGNLNPLRAPYTQIGTPSSLAMSFANGRQHVLSIYLRRLQLYLVVIGSDLSHSCFRQQTLLQTSGTLANLLAPKGRATGPAIASFDKQRLVILEAYPSIRCWK